MAATSLRDTAGLPRLEKYELLEEIGHGGMATVYRAKDPRLGREVAVKVIHRHLRENAEVGTRFVAEARASAKLRHPGIVDVYDVSDEDDPERYLVAELVRGATLRKVLLAHRDMPAEVGASIVLKLCDAVEHAHESAIIHRDIKPENVLVELPGDRAAALQAEPSKGAAAAQSAESENSENASGVRVLPADGPSPRDAPPSTAPPSSSPPSSEPDSSETQSSAREVVTPGPGATRPSKRRGRVSARAPVTPRPRPVDAGVVIKITDFGIAKILDAQGVTSTGQVLGSPAHMAPEQIEGGDVDARTDVFALGVLLYECLVGHLPFEGKNPAQVLRRVLDGTYPPADTERPSVGGRWARIIADALAKDPNERIASAAELAKRINDELTAVGVTDPQAEICAYFVDEAAYVVAHKARLVPKLTARGEAARAAGDARGAAADWNRALALAPDDLAIMKRMASLTSMASRRVLLQRVGAIVAGSAVLGACAFGIARAVRPRVTVVPDSASTAEPSGSPSGEPRAIDGGSAIAVPPASGAPSAARVVTGPPLGPRTDLSRACSSPSRRLPHRALPGAIAWCALRSFLGG